MSGSGSRAWVAAVVLSLALPASAVKTGTWRHYRTEDFDKGTFEKTVSSSLGQLVLGRESTVLLTQNEDVDYVNALAQAPSGVIYAATGPKGIIYKLVDQKADVFARTEDKNVFCLLIAKDGSVLAGTGGEKGRIVRIDRAGKVSPFFQPPDVNYVWAMARGPAGQIYAATGPKGQLFVIDPAGQGKVLYESKQKNLLCLAVDEQAMLYAGSDTDGLVYRVHPETGKAYVLYDAEEPEISAIAIDDGGNVYAATAAADLAKPGKATPQTPAGRPASADEKVRPGQAAGGPTTAARAVGEAVTKQPSPPSRPPSRAKAAGNAIYRIDAQGFVSQVFRQPVTILSMVEAGGTLYIGTGNEGRVYQITPEAEQTIALARLKGSQAVALIRLRDGRLILGTANQAEIVALSDEYAQEGTYTSEVLDAGQISRWGRIRWRGRLAGHTKVSIATRSGNVRDPDLGTWDDWSGEMDQPSGAAIASASARFLQYRLTLSSTGGGSITPVVEEVQISRQAANQPPKVASISFASAKRKPRKPGSPPPSAPPGKKPTPPGPDDIWIIKWEASDPNGDRMVFDLHFRQRGREPWILLDEDIKESQYSWDTKTVPDGRYQLRVIAKDKPDNPPTLALRDARISEEIIVDNTPPRISELRVQRLAAGRVRIQCRITDAGTPITAAHYTVDSKDEWVAVLPEDDIFDSPTESLSFEIDGLLAGEHRVAIKAEDEQRNVGYVATPASARP